MDANILAERLRNTHLSIRPGEKEQLLFKPRADAELTRDVLCNIPRYLFRIVSPLSGGETDGIWMRSEAASRNMKSSREDIFFGLNFEKRETIARTINVHLRWRLTDDFEGNFVSWSSSLLYVLQFIYYRHLNRRDRSSLEEIKLYVIDTEEFPPGTFIRDLDLINAFYKFDDHHPRDLRDFRSLRENTGYYFGEYLSQGSLKIEGKYQMISAKSLFDANRLCRLQPEFGDIYSLLAEKKEPKWAKEVRRLRGIVWSAAKSVPLPSQEMLDRMEAISEIIENFDPGWRFPMAIYFAALIGPEPETEEQGSAPDNVFYACFRSKFAEEQRYYGSPKFRVIAPNTMPELKRVSEICKYFQLREALEFAKKAEASLRRLRMKNGSFLQVADSNETLTGARRTLLLTLNKTQKLCEQVSQAISPSSAKKT
ncbi:hypothetical protein C8Q69DRAFT_528711 [Paecilomyces variotii]|uniref:DUF7587 domain-containing protein n=1 Tax=Byssochlamys spectabilis TaxID=264951 RepID=A0A443HS08_BYSSP|nr:hypothetical protein C8Q69DRAFT_528711 [Paecilomyces variotii]KAJ9365395.1 hypothetical protein DTO280E4_364 [Paecilomyces variotii]RWQ94628.1 hypothetical protein C8Q69DRAFT_528711 [Paecilomyces variotii]